MSAKFIRQFYMSIAILRILYGIDIFLTPPLYKTRGQKGIIEKLVQVQKQAMIHIMGTMHTIAANILDTYANLLPFPLLIDKKCHNEAIN